MTSMNSQIQEGRKKQYLTNSEIHNWYRFVLAFPDHLVTDMLERFGAKDGDVVLDPFCGTGTTPIESMKLGVQAVGIEANPVCVLASQVKTNWQVCPADLIAAANDVIERSSEASHALSNSVHPLFSKDIDIAPLKAGLLEVSPEGRYFVSSGMLKRGWVSEIPFYKTLAILNALKEADIDNQVRAALRLALVAILVEKAGNIRFGPELYVSGNKSDADVLGFFKARIQKMSLDLETVQDLPIQSAKILEGDSRSCSLILQKHGIDHVDFVITSPPYPTEKDYTRQTRLELVFLGYVHDRASLQTIKKAMLRSHSKGIYKADTDGTLVDDIPEISIISDELRMKIANKTHGFAKLYPRIIEEYFGGMYRHLASLFEVLEPGGLCAYVVGDQRTYLQTYTPTGKILGLLAERIGYEVEDLLVWRIRTGTTGSGKELNENILVLKKPH